jgi:hypothetical protein
MKSEMLRPWMVRWMYGVVIVHLLAGMLLPWIGNLSWFDAYHRSVEAGFWAQGAPAIARAQQVWWLSLFGPTIQGLSIWMGVLVCIADRHRSPSVWAWLIAGIVLWAPQDMLISLRADAWIHVWIDCFALITMLPPLIWLCWNDRQNKPAHIPKTNSPAPA